MITSLIVIGGIIGIMLGRLLFRRWFNFLTIYSALWTLVLGLYSLRLIHYYEIIPEAWLFISIASFTLFLSSATVLCAGAVTRLAHSMKNNSQNSVTISRNFLAKAIIILSIMASLSIIYQLVQLILIYGGIETIIANSNQIYSYRIAGKLDLGIPYIGSFAFSACSLAGIYTALSRKITVLSVLPMALVTINGFTSMGRAGFIIASILFLTSFIFTPHQKIRKKNIFIILMLVSAVLIGATIFMSSSRGLIVEFESEDPIMETLRSKVHFLPSIYFYLSGPPVVFSEYLKAGGENVPTGSYCLKPLFSVVAKLGIVEPLNRYSLPYFTPEPMNAGTYLRTLHADFGVFGIVIFPYVLGMAAAMLHLLINRRATLLRITVLSHLYVVIFLSWDINVFQLGYFWVSMVGVVFVSIVHFLYDAK